jgi:hypothetical protein
LKIAVAGFALTQLLVGASKAATVKEANAWEGIMKRSTILYASVVAAIALTANCASAKSINYNASKSNTGNRTAHNTGNGNGQPSMAVKTGGVPQNGATFDPGHGMATGRRQHQP